MLDGHGTLHGLRVDAAQVKDVLRTDISVPSRGQLVLSPADLAGYRLGSGDTVNVRGDRGSLTARQLAPGRDVQGMTEMRPTLDSILDTMLIVVAGVASVIGVVFGLVSGVRERRRFSGLAMCRWEPGWSHPSQPWRVETVESSEIRTAW